ncbi:MULTISPECIES: HEAT repeat domain-containing protein [unclassified Coleofasciculus]|uniref:HEAT repeat domain-containing protein n=1 Tax=unclassified Coleofasciculus TaxID=2692782 RepID=UPI001881CF46|nr:MULTISPECIES: HEAT repeat domain-containing protein [unclassified Coleofasciculus]MBE9129375.1 HEAT repeat domain-containing protein [Coleofasciculus sp. LEGE 07081]MBE9152009.1 HEAT repeat domain-containing protein [Coleofasciculus sp. LEGE 07092]
MSQLEELLQQCTVKLTLPGGWGTGFFVAPEWILTCAHVVQEVKGEPVRVRWQKQENWAKGVVERSLPEPYDLALLRVTPPADANPPCVYLDVTIQSRDSLYLFGYPDQDFPNGCPVTFNCEGLTGDEPALIKFKLGQVRPGMSGAPLLNQRTGKVCGIVKFTRDRSFDLGGGAVPTRVILEQFPELVEQQRSFHQYDQRWSNLVAKPSDIDFQPYLNAIATTYEKWWQLYTLTDAEGKQRQSQDVAPIFDFGLMVQTVQKEEREQRQEGKPEKEKVERFSVLDGLRKYALGEKLEHLLLVGRPGSGKSTALARLMLEEATTQKSEFLKNSDFSTHLPRIPVLVELRYWQGSIAQLIINALTRHGLALTGEQLETVLPQLLILFDGVNELPSEEARSQLSAFRRNHPKVPMIFTTRDLSLGGDLGIEKKLEMQPLTEAQMQAFIRAYLPEQAEAMLRQLKDRLREFGQTPLLLWMLCQLFQQTSDKQLPSNLAGVFQAFTAMYEISSVRKHEVALLKGDVRPLSDRRLWKKALKALASVMMQGETPVGFRVVIHRDEAERELSKIFPNEQFPVRDILDDLLKYHLLQNRSVDQIEFRHQLIQEYYAAEVLLERLPELSDAVLKREYLNYLKWTEPIALMLALVDKEAQALLVVQLALEVDWMLGARLAGEVKREFQAQTMGMVEALEVPDWLKGKLLKQVQSTTSLSESESDYSWEKRLQERMKPELISDEKIIELCSLIENESRWKAASEFERLTGWESSGYSRILLGQKAITRLLNLINHIDSDVRWCVAHILLIIGDRRATQGLLRLLKDPSDDVRKSAVIALDKIGDETAIPDLIEFLKNPSNNVDRVHELRRFGSSALASIGGKQALIGLLSLLEHPDEDVRWCAIDGLGDMGDKDAVIGLIYGLRDCSSNIRSKAAYTLGFIADETVVPELISYLQCVLETSDGECWSVIDALGKIGSKKAIPELHRFLAKSNGYKETAIFALGKIGDESVISNLIYILQTSSLDSKGTAIAILGKMQAEPAIPYFLDILENDPYVRSRNNIAGILGGFQKERAAHILPDLLALLPTESGQYAFRAIQGIQANCKFYNYEIWCEAIQNEKLEIKNGEQGASVGETTNIFNIETFNATNAALNLGGTIHGDQSGTQNH